MRQIPFVAILPVYAALLINTHAARGDNSIQHLRNLEERLNRMLPTQGAVEGFALNADEGEPAAPQNNGWNAQPLCNDANFAITECSFTHKNGHGLFVVGQPGVHSGSNFLVCASMAGQSQSFLDSSELVTSRCMVSSLDWRNGTGRSDYRGVFNWLIDATRYEAKNIPALLAEQCRTAFPEAAYCAPTLLVLPTGDSNLLDVCGLHTQRNDINLVVLRIHQGNSRWKCERKNLAIADSQPRLSVAEWSCVPNAWGYVDPLCALPYIPTTEPLRVCPDEQVARRYPVE
jgi:hypothetical protein